MDALDLLHHRVSCPQLSEPAPNAAQRQAIFKAALRAPDHAGLKPFRFLTVEGEARRALGALFLRAGLADDPGLVEGRRQKLQHMALRAPLLVLVIARLCEHPKVPRGEQRLAAGAAAQNMLLAAHALGLGAMWRTGEMAYHPQVLEGLGLGADEELIGYLYLGTPAGHLKKVPEPDTADFVQAWGNDDERAD